MSIKKETAVATLAYKYLILILHNEVAYPCEHPRHDDDEHTTVASYLAMILTDDMVTHSWYQCIDCNVQDKALIAAGKKLTV